MSGSAAWPRVKLGDVLRHVARPLTVGVDGIYREIGIRSHGKGLFHKAPVTGAALGDKRVFHVEPGDFVLNIVFAWEGAIGLVSEAERGMIASHRFPCFRAADGRVDLRFLERFFQTPAGLELLGRVSPGGAGRNRTLNRTSFMQQEIALPPLAEQQRIVGRINELVELQQQASELRTDASTTLEALRARIRHSSLSGAATGLVADFVRFQTGYAFKSEWFSENGIRLARNANIGHGRLDWSETVRIPADRRAEFSAFELQAGDILLALDRPLISTGVKVVQVVASDLPALLLQRVARAKFTGDRLLPSYFFRWLQSPLFASAIDPGRSNGVPHISHKDVEKLRIHVPAVSEQERIVESLVEAEREMQALERLQAQTRSELDALLPAILDRAFAGAL